MNNHVSWVWALAQTQVHPYMHTLAYCIQMYTHTHTHTHTHRGTHKRNNSSNPDTISAFLLGLGHQVFETKQTFCFDNKAYKYRFVQFIYLLI